MRPELDSGRRAPPSTRQALLVSSLSAVALTLVAWAWLPFGLDHFDQGYVLSAGALLLEHPEDVVPHKTGGMWLTLLLVALLLELGGDYGVLLVRLAVVPVAVATTAFGCLLVRQRVPMATLVALGACTHLVARSWRVDGFLSYPLLSAFLFGLGVLSLTDGSARDSRRLLLAGGAALGIAPFARLPNVAGLVLLVLPVLFGTFGGRSLRPGMRQSAWAAGGAVAAVAVMGVTMAGMGHVGFFMDGLAHLRTMAALPDSPYNSFDLLLEMAADISLSVVLTGGLLLFAGCFAAVAAVTPSRPARVALVILGSLISLVFGMQTLQIQLIPYGVLLLGLSASVFLPERSPRDRVVDAGALLVLLLVPLGAATGIRTGAATAALFAGPVGAATVVQEIHRRWPRDPARAKAPYRGRFVVVAASVVAGFLFVGGILRLPTTARGISGYSRPASQFRSPGLRGVLVSPVRATAFDAAALQLRGAVGEGGRVLAIGHIPLIYFLSGTRPYLGETWPMLRAPGYLERRLPEALEEQGQLPVVIRASEGSLNWAFPAKETFATAWRPVATVVVKLLRVRWFRETLIWWYQASDREVRLRDDLIRWTGREPLLAGGQQRRLEANGNLLRHFLLEEGYARLWTNGAFEILVPPCWQRTAGKRRGQGCAKP